MTTRTFSGEAVCSLIHANVSEGTLLFFERGDVCGAKRWFESDKKYKRARVLWKKCKVMRARYIWRGSLVMWIIQDTYNIRFIVGHEIHDIRGTNKFSLYEVINCLTKTFISSFYSRNEILIQKGRWNLCKRHTKMIVKAMWILYFYIRRNSKKPLEIGILHAVYYYYYYCKWETRKDLSWILWWNFSFMHKGILAKIKWNSESFFFRVKYY